MIAALTAWEDEEMDASVEEQEAGVVTPAERLADQVEAWAYCGDGVVALAADVIVHDPADAGAVGVLAEAAALRDRIKALGRRLAPAFRPFEEQ